jgi:hypothetical protein
VLLFWFIDDFSRRFVLSYLVLDIIVISYLNKILDPIIHLGRENIFLLGRDRPNPFWAEIGPAILG